MKFNLKKYAKNIEETTQKQLENSRSSKELEDVQEVQLKDYRAWSPSQLTEVQLDSYSVRNESDKDETPMEKKLRKIDKGEQKSLSVNEVQLEKFREGDPSELTEKQLASSDLRKNASKVEKPIDKKLDDLKKPRAEPTTVSEDQLEDYRFDWPTQITEKQLDAPRKSATQQTVLVEGQLNESKGGLVKHRNEDASKGNINKLEEKRLAGEKASIQEKQKAELASETPKDRMWDKKPDADGLRLAQKIDDSLAGIMDFTASPLGSGSTTGDDTDFNIVGDFDGPELDLTDEDEDEEEDEGDKSVILDKDIPTVTDAGGTKIVQGTVKFRLKPFLDEQDNLMRDKIEQKVRDHLSSRHSIKAPVLGEIRINVQEQTGVMGYLASLQ